jgi:CDP-diacylglycerol pyrophosphatase
MPVRFSTLLAAGALLLLLLGGALADDSGFLWGVVQACVANYHTTGTAFPCLEVKDEDGPPDGYVVLRAPLEKTHIVIAPTARIKGIEDPALQSPSAANFFEDAWEARHYVVDRAPRQLERDEIGLAINSKTGRSQDQLHIHVDCVKASVGSALQRSAAKMRFNTWSPFKVDAKAPEYHLMKLKGENLKEFNVFRLAVKGLAIKQEDLGSLTIAVIGASFVDGAKGFYLLARSSDQPATSEDLLDHTCSTAN